MIDGEEEIERSDTLIRIVLSLLFVLILGVVEMVLGVLVAFSLLYTLLTRNVPGAPVRAFSNRVVAYAYRIYRYLVYNEPEVPFPFSEFPDVVEPTRWSYERTDADRIGIRRSRREV